MHRRRSRRALAVDRRPLRWLDRRVRPDASRYAYYLSSRSSTLPHSLSLTSLLAVSAHVKSRTARLILLAIFLPASLILASLLTIPRLHCRRLAHRVGLGLCSLTGAWLFVLGIDVFTKVGLLDAVTLFVRDAGISVATEAVGTGAEAAPIVVLWQDRRCQGLLAGAWLL